MCTIHLHAANIVPQHHVYTHSQRNMYRINKTNISHDDTVTEWCQRYKDFDWSKCLFADEKIVKLGNLKRME